MGHQTGFESRVEADLSAIKEVLAGLDKSIRGGIDGSPGVFLRLDRLEQQRKRHATILFVTVVACISSVTAYVVPLAFKLLG